MSAEIRQLTAEDFEARVALSQFAFQFRFTEEQLEGKREKYLPEQEYGLFGVDGRLLSALALIPFEAWVRGRKMAMGGIAGVVSWPDARRQGGVTRLLLHALGKMRENGQSLSMLHPFDFPFYRKYGYELTIERKNYTLETKHLPPRRETAGTVRIVKKDMKLLDPVYQAYASRYDGTLVRDAHWWEQNILVNDSDISALFEDAEGRAQGYILYKVANRKMEVRDFVAVTEQARTALWSYAANHDSMIRELTMTVPADDPLPFLVPDPRFKQEIEPYFMSRIVDAEAFVRQYPFSPSDRADEFEFAIEDSNAAWNDGLFRLAIAADGSARLEKRAGSRGAMGANAGGLVCDIGALTALLLGGRSAELLHRVGRIRGPEKAVSLLDRRVPLQRPYLADFF